MSHVSRVESVATRLTLRKANGRVWWGTLAGNAPKPIPSLYGPTNSVGTTRDHMSGAPARWRIVPPDRCLERGFRLQMAP